MRCFKEPSVSTIFRFHRVRKREKRKKLIKEIEDLLEKDPEAAREKLKVLDQDRAFERATLKHRGTGKWSVQLRQYASKNPGMQRLITEHLKLGRELKSKHGLENVLKSYEEEEEEDSEGAVNHLTKAEMLEVNCFTSFTLLFDSASCRTSKTRTGSRTAAAAPAYYQESL